MRLDMNVFGWKRSSLHPQQTAVSSSKPDSEHPPPPTQKIEPTTPAKRQETPLTFMSDFLARSFWKTESLEKAENGSLIVEKKSESELWSSTEKLNADHTLLSSSRISGSHESLKESHIPVLEDEGGFFNDNEEVDDADDDENKFKNDEYDVEEKEGQEERINEILLNQLGLPGVGQSYCTVIPQVLSHQLRRQILDHITSTLPSSPLQQPSQKTNILRGGEGGAKQLSCSKSSSKNRLLVHSSNDESTEDIVAAAAAAAAGVDVTASATVPTATTVIAAAATTTVGFPMTRAYTTGTSTTTAIAGTNDHILSSKTRAAAAVIPSSGFNYMIPPGPVHPQQEEQKEALILDTCGGGGGGSSSANAADEGTTTIMLTRGATIATTAHDTNDAPDDASNYNTMPGMVNNMNISSGEGSTDNKHIRMVKQPKKEKNSFCDTPTDTTDTSTEDDRATQDTAAESFVLSDNPRAEAERNRVSRPPPRHHKSVDEGHYITAPRYSQGGGRGGGVLDVLTSMERTPTAAATNRLRHIHSAACDDVVHTTPAAIPLAPAPSDYSSSTTQNSSCSSSASTAEPYSSASAAATANSYVRRSSVCGGGGGGGILVGGEDHLPPYDDLLPPVRMTRLLSLDEGVNLLEKKYKSRDDGKEQAHTTTTVVPFGDDDDLFDCRPSIQRFHCTLLFVDISGFTPLSTRLDVDSLKTHINAYFTVMLNIVHKHGGDVVKFAGDAIYVSWQTTPLQSAVVGAQKAYACALEINAACNNYKVSFQAVDDAPAAAAATIAPSTKGGAGGGGVGIWSRSNSSSSSRSGSRKNSGNFLSFLTATTTTTTTSKPATAGATAGAAVDMSGVSIDSTDESFDLPIVEEWSHGANMSTIRSTTAYTYSDDTSTGTRASLPSNIILARRSSSISTSISISHSMPPSSTADGLAMGSRAKKVKSKSLPIPGFSLPNRQLQQQLLLGTPPSLPNHQQQLQQQLLLGTPPGNIKRSVRRASLGSHPSDRTTLTHRSTSSKHLTTTTTNTTATPTTSTTATATTGRTHPQPAPRTSSSYKLQGPAHQLLPPLQSFSSGGMATAAPSVAYLSVHSGISCGIVAGIDVGSHGRFEYLLAGKPLNDLTIAESQARLGEIVISPEAHYLIHGSVERPIGLPVDTDTTPDLPSRLSSSRMPVGLGTVDTHPFPSSSSSSSSSSPSSTTTDNLLLRTASKLRNGTSSACDVSTGTLARLFRANSLGNETHCGCQYTDQGFFKPTTVRFRTHSVDNKSSRSHTPPAGTTTTTGGTTTNSTQRSSFYNNSSNRLSSGRFSSFLPSSPKHFLSSSLSSSSHTQHNKFPSTPHKRLSSTPFSQPDKPICRTVSITPFTKNNKKPNAPPLLFNVSSRSAAEEGDYDHDDDDNEAVEETEDEVLNSSFFNNSKRVLFSTDTIDPVSKRIRDDRIKWFYLRAVKYHVHEAARSTSNSSSGTVELSTKRGGAGNSRTSSSSRNINSGFSSSNSSSGRNNISSGYQDISSSCIIDPDPLMLAEIRNLQIIFIKIDFDVALELERGFSSGSGNGSGSSSSSRRGRRGGRGGAAADNNNDDISAAAGFLSSPFDYDQQQLDVDDLDLDEFGFLKRSQYDEANDRIVLDRLQKCMSVLVEVFTERGGQIRQFICDDKGTVCIGTFGLRGSVQEDNAAAAVETALSVITRLGSSSTASDLNLSASIGVTSGRAYCGFVGSPTRHEYTVMGPAVNLSARLMCAAQPGTILCDSKTRENDRFHKFEKLAEVKAKGYTEPVATYRPVPAAASGGGGGSGLSEDLLGEEDPYMTIPVLSREQTCDFDGTTTTAAAADDVTTSTSSTSIYGGVGRGSKHHHGRDVTASSLSPVRSVDCFAALSGGEHFGRWDQVTEAVQFLLPPDLQQQQPQPQQRRHTRGDDDAVTAAAAVVVVASPPQPPAAAVLVGPPTAATTDTEAAVTSAAAVIPASRDAGATATATATTAAPALSSLEAHHDKELRVLLVTGPYGIGRSNFITTTSQRVMRLAKESGSGPHKRKMYVFCSKANSFDSSSPFLIWRHVLLRLLATVASTSSSSSFSPATAAAASPPAVATPAAGAIKNAQISTVPDVTTAPSSPSAARIPPRSSSVTTTKTWEIGLNLLIGSLPEALKACLYFLDPIMGTSFGDPMTSSTNTSKSPQRQHQQQQQHHLSLSKLHKTVELLAHIIQQSVNILGAGCVLITLDDIHCIDSASRALLSHLWKHGNGFAILAAHRTASLMSSTAALNECKGHELFNIMAESSKRFKHINLDPLDRQSIGSIVELALQPTTALPSSDTVDAIYELCAGNPLFACEIAKAAVVHLVGIATSTSSSISSSTSSSPQYHMGGGNHALPPIDLLADFIATLRPNRIGEMICFRFDKLSPSCQLLLKVASVCGTEGAPFSVSMISFVLPEFSSADPTTKPELASESYLRRKSSTGANTAEVIDRLREILQQCDFISVVKIIGEASQKTIRRGDVAVEGGGERWVLDTSEKVHSLKVDGCADILTVIDANTVFEFKSALVQETIYDLMLIQQKKRMHRRVAEYLEQQAIAATVLEQQERFSQQGNGEEGGVNSGVESGAEGLQGGGQPLTGEVMSGVDIYLQGTHWRYACIWLKAMACFYKSGLYLEHLGSTDGCRAHWYEAYEMYCALRHDAGFDSLAHVSISISKSRVSMTSAGVRHTIAQRVYDHNDNAGAVAATPPRRDSCNSTCSSVDTREGSCASPATAGNGADYYHNRDNDRSSRTRADSCSSSPYSNMSSSPTMTAFPSDCPMTIEDVYNIFEGDSLGLETALRLLTQLTMNLLSGYQFNIADVTSLLNQATQLATLTQLPAAVATGNGCGRTGSSHDMRGHLPHIERLSPILFGGYGRQEPQQQQHVVVYAVAGSTLPDLVPDDSGLLDRRPACLSTKIQATGNSNRSSSITSTSIPPMIPLAGAPFGLYDRDLMYPILSGISLQYFGGILPDDTAHSKWAGLCDIFLNSAEQSGNTVHILRALACKVHLDILLRRYTDAVDTCDKMRELYNFEVHSAELIRTYGSDYVLLAFGIVTVILALSGRIMRAIEYAEFTNRCVTHMKHLSTMSMVVTPLSVTYGLLDDNCMAYSVFNDYLHLMLDHHSYSYSSTASSSSSSATAVAAAHDGSGVTGGGGVVNPTSVFFLELYRRLALLSSSSFPSPNDNDTGSSTPVRSATTSTKISFGDSITTRGDNVRLGTRQELRCSTPWIPTMLGINIDDDIIGDSFIMPPPRPALHPAASAPPVVEAASSAGGSLSSSSSASPIFVTVHQSSPLQGRGGGGGRQLHQQFTSETSSSASSPQSPHSFPSSLRRVSGHGQALSPLFMSSSPTTTSSIPVIFPTTAAATTGTAATSSSLSSSDVVMPVSPLLLTLSRPESERLSPSPTTHDHPHREQTDVDRHTTGYYGENAITPTSTAAAALGTSSYGIRTSSSMSGSNGSPYAGATPLHQLRTTYTDKDTRDNEGNDKEHKSDDSKEGDNNNNNNNNNTYNGTANSNDESTGGGMATTTMFRMEGTWTHFGRSIQCVKAELCYLKAQSLFTLGGEEAGGHTIRDDGKLLLSIDGVLRDDGKLLVRLPAVMEYCDAGIRYIDNWIDFHPKLETIPNRIQCLLVKAKLLVTRATVINNQRHHMSMSTSAPADDAVLHHKEKFLQQSLAVESMDQIEEKSQLHEEDEVEESSSSAGGSSCVDTGKVLGSRGNSSRQGGRWKSTQDHSILAPNTTSSSSSSSSSPPSPSISISVEEDEEVSQLRENALRCLEECLCYAEQYELPLAAVLAGMQMVQAGLDKSRGRVVLRHAIEKIRLINSSSAAAIAEHHDDDHHDNDSTNTAETKTKRNVSGSCSGGILGIVTGAVVGGNTNTTHNSFAHNSSIGTIDQPPAAAAAAAAAAAPITGLDTSASFHHAHVANTTTTTTETTTDTTPIGTTPYSSIHILTLSTDDDITLQWMRSVPLLKSAIDLLTALETDEEYTI